MAKRHAAGNNNKQVVQTIKVTSTYENGVTNDTIFCSKNNFLFAYSWPQDFSRYIFKTPRWIPVLHRSILFMYFISFLLYDLTIMGSYLFIYLTYWDFILYNISNTVGLVVAIDNWYFQRVSVLVHKDQWQNNLPVLHKTYWIIYTPAYSTSILVTVCYWALLYPTDPTNSVNISDLNVHLFTTVVCIIEIFVCAIPWRWHHIWLGYIGACIYASFTGVHYAAGWTNFSNNQTYIYSILNYKQSPRSSSIMCLVLALLGPLITHSACYGLYRVRQAMLNKFRKTIT